MESFHSSTHTFSMCLNHPMIYPLTCLFLQLKSPDLFDMYFAGIVFLQIAIPTLRSSVALKNFNLEIRTCGYDLNKWRVSTRMRSDFQILDSDSGRGWDLATKLIFKRCSQLRGRLSAAAALRWRSGCRSPFKTKLLNHKMSCLEMICRYTCSILCFFHFFTWLIFLTLK